MNEIEIVGPSIYQNFLFKNQSFSGNRDCVVLTYPTKIIKKTKTALKQKFFCLHLKKHWKKNIQKFKKK